MEYTVQKLGILAGVSTRTLRYYDEIGILKPARINSSGYRIYGKEEVDRLQQILFFKELGVSLDEIKHIISSPSFNAADALKEHRKKLLEKKEQIEVLIANVEKTIALSERGIPMLDEEKFEGLKQNLIKENENKYGEEIRKKYGNEVVNQSNTKLKNMKAEDFQNVTSLEMEIKTTLQEAFISGDPSGPLAQKAADLHKQWLSYYWNSYSREAHANLADMYVSDERFKAYYDEKQPGTAQFLREAILIYTGMKP